MRLRACTQREIVHELRHLFGGSHDAEDVSPVGKALPRAWLQRAARISTIGVNAAVACMRVCLGIPFAEVEASAFGIGFKSLFTEVAWHEVVENVAAVVALPPHDVFYADKNAPVGRIAAAGAAAAAVLFGEGGGRLRRRHDVGSESRLRTAAFAFSSVA